MELSKRDKKIVKALIDKAMHEEFRIGMEGFDAILKKWRDTNSGHQQHYHKLFSDVYDFDKHIARRYDGLTGSRYYFTLAMQVAEGLIDEKELDELSAEVRDGLILWAKRSRE
ncbi:hypothetical protein BH09BAC6_BH09BAC6_24800 [soil metagenome]|jgi:hypothetical protein